MLFDLCLILGVAALSLALRSYAHPLMNKLGAIGIFATSFLIGWRLSGYVAIGVFCAASWLLLPWLEILTRIRKLRLPLEKNLRHKTPPGRDTFPALGELTDEVEGEKFEFVEDAGWDWDDYQQFFRLFYKSSERAQAAVCLIDQNEIAFYYLSISSRAKDGTIWTTWNYPFSYSLKLVPQLRINRLRSDYTFLEMYESHRDWLRRHGVLAEALVDLDPDEIQCEIQQDLRAQILHNIANGVLQKTDEGQIRYSWRGLFFIWIQFLRDIVRLS
ncbi:MAG: hypothetical protein QOD99_1688 [Chthoniobacter sp.]|jgi:hypothetical protein|nr:hypothetical protein [Chthoniobacter sp.]